MTARGQSGGARLRFGRSPIPWQEFVDAIDWMIGDAFDDESEPSLGIDFVELARLCRKPNYAEFFR